MKWLSKRSLRRVVFVMPALSDGEERSERAASAEQTSSANRSWVLESNKAQWVVIKMHAFSHIFIHCI